MCITFFGINCFKGNKFFLMFNRDEDLHRPTTPLKVYDGDLIYSLDEISGGTFLCINKATGNFACLLNNAFAENPYKEGLILKRGAIPIDFCKINFVESELNQFFDNLKNRLNEYNGYNFICGNFNANFIYYFTNNFEGKEVNKDILPIILKDNKIYGIENKFIEEDSLRVNQGLKLIQEAAENNKDSTTLIEEINKCAMENGTKLLSNEGIVDYHSKSFFKYVQNSVYIEDKVVLNGKELLLEFGTRQNITIQVDENNNVLVTERFGGIEKNDYSKFIINRQKDVYSKFNFQLENNKIIK